MSAITIDQALEEVYTALHNDNRDLDHHISSLKLALAATGQREAVFQCKRLAQNNRHGRKTMESYFRQRGVDVVFEE